MTTEKYPVSNLSTIPEEARGALMSAAEQAGLDRKETMCIGLLAEETLGMLKMIVTAFDGEMWLEAATRRCAIHVTARASMNAEKKRELLSVSSTGANASVKTFMGRIGELLSDALTGYGETVTTADMSALRYDAFGAAGVNMADPLDMTPIWTLENYRRELADSADQGEAWDELEKSIVANLADNVIVGVRGGEIELVIAKDFSAPAKERAITPFTSEKVVVDNTGKGAAEAETQARRFSNHCHLPVREAMHVSLLVEETVGMVREMTDSFTGEIWLEGDDKQVSIRLAANTGMTKEKLNRLLTASTSGKNAAPRGFMAKLGTLLSHAFVPDVDDPELRNYLSMELPEYIDFGMMHMPYSAGTTQHWSMVTYRDRLSAEKNAPAQDRDELERSIVVKLASDVTVAVKGDHVDLTILRKFPA